MTDPRPVVDDVASAVALLERFAHHEDFAHVSVPAAVKTCWRGWRLANHHDQGNLSVVALNRGEVWAVVTVDLSQLSTDLDWRTLATPRRKALLVEAFQGARIGEFADLLDQVSTPVPGQSLPMHVTQATALLESDHPDRDEIRTLLALGGFNDVGAVISHDRRDLEESLRFPELRAEIETAVRDRAVLEGWDYPTVETRIDTEYARARAHMIAWLNETAPGWDRPEGSRVDYGSAWHAEVDRYLTDRGW